jgi:AcrR family transcriptional regulator
MTDAKASPRKQATQSAILKAAYTLFSRKGFSNTTTREIAESAQVNELTLFRHFQNKTNILTQVIGTYMTTQKIERMFSQLEKMGFEDGFHSFARMLLAELEEKYPMIRLMIIEATANPELKSEVGPIIVKLRENLVRHLRRGVDEGRVREDLDLDLVAQSFLWIFLSYVINRSDVGQQFCPYPPEDVAQASTEIFLKGLRPNL